jgi:hypothetical protein
VAVFAVCCGAVVFRVALTVNRTPIMSESGGETVVAYATAIKTGLRQQGGDHAGQLRAVGGRGAVDFEPE